MIIFTLFSETDNYTELGNQEYENGNYKQAIKYYKKSLIKILKQKQKIL